MKQTSLTAAKLLCASLLWGTGCFSPPSIRQLVPSFDPMPGQPRQGNGRVVLDVVGARCRVRLATSRPAAGHARIYQWDPNHVSTPVLCVTPCQIELPKGTTRLLFCDRAAFDVAVSAQPSIFRAYVGGYSSLSALQWVPATSPTSPRRPKLGSAPIP